jgi:hypothetical protein
MRRTIRATTAGAITVLLLFTLAPPASAAAQINWFSPTSGPVGTVVTIHGSGFLGSTVVYLKGVPMPFTVNSDTQITATVAAGAQTGLWSVQTPTKRVWSDQVFTVTSATGLNISGFTPTSGPVGTKVTITGTGFSGVINVYLKGTKMPFTVDSGTQITATVAAGAKTGLWSVETASKRVWSDKSFTVTAGTLDITSFSPTTGPVGTVVTIRGTGFSAVTAVYLDGKPMPYTINNDSQITATVAAGAQSGLWSVQTPGNRVWSDTQFRVTSPTHARMVSLTLSGHLKASGRVTVLDGYGACASNVPVVIKRYRHGRYRWVVTVSTGPDGGFRAPLRDKAGKYIARAKEIQLVNGQTCLPDRSAKHRHHH